MKATEEAVRQAVALRAPQPWAVADGEQVVIAVFATRAEAEQFAQQDPTRRVFDATETDLEIYW